MNITTNIYFDIVESYDAPKFTFTDISTLEEALVKAQEIAPGAAQDYEFIPPSSFEDYSWSSCTIGTNAKTHTLRFFVNPSEAIYDVPRKPLENLEEFLEKLSQSLEASQGDLRAQSQEFSDEAFAHVWALRNILR